MILKKTMLFFLLLGTLLQAQSINPILYRAIGDPVYNAAQGYKELLTLPYFQEDHEALKSFVTKSEALKKWGMKLDENGDKKSRKDYIKKLRAIAKEAAFVQKSIEQDLDTLLKMEDFETLRRLSKNSYYGISHAKAVKVAMSHSQEEINAILDAKAYDKMDHKQLLAHYKEKLLLARIEESPEVACLNDITAMIYWIADIDEKRLDHPCDAYKSAQQLESFYQKAQKSCGLSNHYFQEWQERSAAYRGEALDQLEIECGH